MGRHGNGVRQCIEAVPVILRSLPPNMRLKLPGARVGRIAFPRRLAFLFAAPSPCASGHCARSLSAIR
jgi:hypothetical protein